MAGRQESLRADSYLVQSQGRRGLPPWSLLFVNAFWTLRARSPGATTIKNNPFDAPLFSVLTLPIAVQDIGTEAPNECRTVNVLKRATFDATNFGKRIRTGAPLRGTPQLGIVKIVLRKQKLQIVRVGPETQEHYLLRIVQQLSQALFMFDVI